MAVSYYPIITIASASALSLLGDATIFTVLPSYYTHLGLLPLQVGILLSVNRWIRLVSNRLADRCYRTIPAAPLLAVVFFLVSMVTASYGYFPIFIALLISRILWGVCFSFIRQAGIMTVAATADDTHLGKWMGLHRGIALTGLFLGTLFGGFGYDHFGWSTTFIVFGVISMGSIPLGFFSQKSGRHVKSSLRKARHLPINYKLMMCGFVTGVVGFGLIISTLGLIVKEQVVMSIILFDHTIGVASITGMVLAIRWFLDILGSPVLGAFADRIGRAQSLPMVFLIGASALGFACLPLGLFWLIGCILILFLCDTMLGILVASWAGRQGGVGVADYATGFDLGSALGPLIGWSIAHFDLPTYLIFLAGALFYAIGGVVTHRGILSKSF